MPKHETHSDISARLKRAEGHLRKVILMIEAKKECVDVAQQLQAVVNAIQGAKKIFIQDHLEHCLDAVIEGKKAFTRKELQGFKEITKYL